MTTRIKEFDHIFILLSWHMAEQQKPENERDTKRMAEVSAEIKEYSERQKALKEG